MEAESVLRIREPQDSPDLIRGLRHGQPDTAPFQVTLGIDQHLDAAGIYELHARQVEFDPSAFGVG